MNVAKQPDIPGHGNSWGRGGSMVSFSQEEAEEQAADDSLESGEGVKAVHIIWTAEARTPTS
jgi:hypothetical protein